MGDNTQKRWHATIVYEEGAAGRYCVMHNFEEIGELEDIIEHGPNFYTIVSCTITLNGIEHPHFPMEKMLATA